VNRAALDRATAALDPPFAVVDLDAFDANAADLLRRAGSTALRLASKSVRCRALQRRALDAGFAGSCASRCPRRCGWPTRASTTSSSPTPRPTGRRCARWPTARTATPSP
jgi:hypothetical protein